MYSLDEIGDNKREIIKYTANALKETGHSERSSHRCLRCYQTRHLRAYLHCFTHYSDRIRCS